MKKLRLTSILSSSLFVCALGFGTLVSSSSALAQNPNPIKVDIPFAFQTGNVQMPAGMYQIDNERGGVVLLRGPDHMSEFVVMHSAIASAASSNGKVIFHRYGNKYFLSQIWRPGTTTGLESSRTRAEKNAVLAMNKQDPDLVQLAFYTGPQR
jgi:hypothetical protein